MKEQPSRKQRVTLTFEKNGSDWGKVSDTMQKVVEIDVPEDFGTGVHIIGAKVEDTIIIKDGPNEALLPTGWVKMVANIITDRDAERIVGKALTIVDATMVDKEQRDAFKSLLKQAIYSSYSNVVERSSQNVQEQGYRYGADLTDYS